MASFALLFLLLAVVSLNVDGSVLKSQRQNTDGDEDCSDNLMQCFAMFGRAVGDGDSMDTLLEDGMEAFCPPFINSKNCFEAALRSCGDNNPHRQTVTAIAEIIRFACEQEIRVLDANRQCIFGPETTRAMQTQCPTHGLGHMCSLIADNECAFNLIRSRCNNPSLANKLKNFAKKLQREAGCRTARSMQQMLEKFSQS